MQTSLAVTALLMGLAGGPHCIAMCGAACAGIGKAAGEHRTSALWGFQLGRLASYSALGAVAAASMQGLGWLTTQTAVMRPVWTLFHVAVMLMGLMLVVVARQPVWLDQARRAGRLRCEPQAWWTIPGRPERVLRRCPACKPLMLGPHAPTTSELRVLQLRSAARVHAGTHLLLRMHLLCGVRKRRAQRALPQLRG